MIRPEHIVLTTADGPGAGSRDSAVNRFRGRVSQVAFLGEATECVVQVGDVALLVRSMAGQYDGSEAVEIYLPPEKTLAIADDEGSRNPGGKTK